MAACPQDLLDRVAHQLTHYADLISEDSFAEVSELSLNLNRLNRINLLHETLANNK